MTASFTPTAGHLSAASFLGEVETRVYRALLEATGGSTENVVSSIAVELRARLLGPDVQTSLYRLKAKGLVASLEGGRWTLLPISPAAWRKLQKGARHASR